MRWPTRRYLFICIYIGLSQFLILLILTTKVLSPRLRIQKPSLNRSFLPVLHAFFGVSKAVYNIFIQFSFKLETINAGDADGMSPPHDPAPSSPPLTERTEASDTEPVGYSAWPRPPDVSEVNRDAHHLATQAMERAAHRHRMR